jgi:hypothetical protein
MKATIQEYKNNVAKLYIEAESGDSVVIPEAKKTIKMQIHAETKEQFNDEVAKYLTAYKNGLIAESAAISKVKEADVINTVVRENIAVVDLINLDEVK